MTELRRRVVAPLVVCFAGLALVACGEEESVTLEAAPGVSITGEQSSIQLPHGRLSFQVTDAEKVAADSLSSGEPADGELVGVDWTWEPREGIPPLVSGFSIADDVPADVRVRVEGTWHELGPAYDTTEGGTSGAAAYISASDDVTAADVTLAVAFDGVEQTVSGDGSGLEAGAATALYEQTGEGASPECTAALSPQQATATTSCEATFVELAYVTDLGWAASGTTWVVADVTVNVTRLVVDGEPEQVVSQSEVTTINGADPAAVVLSEPGAAGVLRTQSVFEVDDGADLELDYTRTVTTSQGEDVAEVTGQAVAPRG